MPKKPKSRFSSPFVIARRPIVPLTSFSPAVVRGIVRGLLSHICMIEKRKTLTTRWLQMAERRIMSHANGAMATIGARELSNGQDSAMTECLAIEAERMLGSLRSHTYFTLNADDAWILPVLTRTTALQQKDYDKVAFSRPYDEVDRKEQRAEWLHEEIPGLLKILVTWSTCLHPHCVGRTSCPSPPHQKLVNWAKTQSAAVLRNNLLGHFHGISPERVRRLLYDRPKPLSQS